MLDVEYRSPSVRRSKPAESQLISDGRRALIAGRILVDYDEELMIVGCILGADACPETEVTLETAKAWLWDLAQGAHALTDPAGELWFVRCAGGWTVQRKTSVAAQGSWATANLTDDEFAVLPSILEGFIASHHRDTSTPEHVEQSVDWPPAPIIFW